MNKLLRRISSHGNAAVTPRGKWFQYLQQLLKLALVAQQVEHQTFNLGVSGSIPDGGTI